MFAACRLDTFGIINRFARYRSNLSKLAVYWLKDIAQTLINYKILDKVKIALDITTAFKKERSVYMGYIDKLLKANLMPLVTPLNAALLYRRVMGITDSDSGSLEDNLSKLL